MTKAALETINVLFQCDDSASYISEMMGSMSKLASRAQARANRKYGRGTLEIGTVFFVKYSPLIYRL